MAVRSRQTGSSKHWELKQHVYGRG
jgi:hypothetical protein